MYQLPLAQNSHLVNGLIRCQDAPLDAAIHDVALKGVSDPPGHVKQEDLAVQEKTRVQKPRSH
jgi:hypothetical protein